MIIIHELSLIIIHNPKCAGKALRDAFLALDADVATFWHWSFSVQLGRHIDMAHLPLNLLRDYPEWALFERYTVIAVIRNPVDRFFSALKEHESQHNRKLNDEEYLLDLDEIRVEHDPRYIHFCPQHRFTHLGNKRKVDFIARQENLIDDLRAIGVIAGLGEKYFDVIEGLPSHQVTSEIVSDDRKETFMPLIKRLYLRDFLLFGYKLGVIEPDKIDDENSEGLFAKLNCYAYDYIDWINNEDHKAAYDRFLSVNKMKDKIQSLKDCNEKLDSTIAERDTEINAFYNSHSWRLTRPLRFFARLMRW